MHKHDIKSYSMKLIPYQKTMWYRKYCFLMYSCKVYCWEWKLYQLIGQLGKSWPPANFLLMPSPQTSLGAFISINFTLFCHFQDLSEACTNPYGEHIFIDWKYVKIIWWYDGHVWNWSIGLIRYTFWEQFVIRSCTSMILFKTGDLIPLIYSIKCMCGRLSYLLI